MEQIKLNVSLLRRRVPNLTAAAKSVGLRAATVSNLCTGKIPIERAEVKTLIALARLADCTLDELIIRGNSREMLETGIKVLDLFAPLVSGGTVGFIARPGMGQLVLLAEIFKRLSEKRSETVFLLPNEVGPGVSDVIEVSSKVCTTGDEVYEHVFSIGKEVDILLAADRSTVLTGEIYSIQEKLVGSGFKITTFLVDPRGNAVDEEDPFGPLETLWQFDAELISRNIFPAVNPVQSTSTILEDAHIDSTHMLIQQRAKKLLRRYRELRFLVNTNGFEKLPAYEAQVFMRGERLEAYLTQPFFTTESVTKKGGQYVPIQDTLQDVRQIVDGSTDNLEVKEFSYIGSLSGLSK